MCILAMASGCSDDSAPSVMTDADADANDIDSTTTVPVEDTFQLGELSVTVLVTLDGLPAPDATVVLGGATKQWRTGTDGQVQVEVVLGPLGSAVLLGSHPDARTGGVEVVDSADATATITLERYDASDNLDYRFQHPGTPEDRSNTSRCGHCHVTFDDQWVASAHSGSASNPWLWNVYEGSTADADRSACETRGGDWRAEPTPGGGPASTRCFVSDGVSGPGATAMEFGGCADCHAPGIDGALGGRDLRDAEDIAYEFGVHCDVCHKVDAVDLDAAPGVAGRLKLTRPSERSPSLSLGTHKPLTFGPHHDVLNPRMGNVQRDHYRQSQFCAGCHEQAQPVLVAGATIDLTRWPSGKLPIHTTYGEWLDGPLNPGATCQSCHMPPEPALGNGAELSPMGQSIGSIVAGWRRPPGDTKKHTFQGPKSQPEMLANAAFVDVASTQDGDRLSVQATTQNVGPGHAIPTGEPLRAMILVVEARCGATPLAAIGGDAVADVAGYDGVKAADEDWTKWAEARVGDLVRVVSRPGGFHDYIGHGRFGAAFSPEQKGLPVEHVVGERRVTAVDADGTLTFSDDLPAGDRAYLVQAGGPGPPALAGRPGVVFAKVLVGADGLRMVPHHAAVDVASDLRLRPGQRWVSEHVFDAAGCETAPTVEARLLYRRAPRWLAIERQWVVQDQEMTAVLR
ncbi:MAG: hypothetical protein ACI9MR_000676 [Myxococcota bacterium]|jgi:hypothetical protein